MGRPSKLTPSQWTDIERRAAAGENVAALAKEFGVARSTVSERVSVISDRVRETAHKVADAQTALAALPVAHQYSAISLAEKLRNISTSLACAAELGAKTSHRLHALANDQAGKVDDAHPLGNRETLQGLAVLTKLANDAAVVPLNLLAANKETIRRAADDEDAGRPVSESDRISRIAQIMAAAKQREADERDAHDKDLA